MYYSLATCILLSDFQKDYDIAYNESDFVDFILKSLVLSDLIFYFKISVYA